MGGQSALPAILFVMPLVHIFMKMVQKLFYSLLHRCSAETLLELCENKKYLGATDISKSVALFIAQPMIYYLRIIPHTSNYPME